MRNECAQYLFSFVIFFSFSHLYQGSKTLWIGVVENEREEKEEEEEEKRDKSDTTMRQIELSYKI